MRTSTILTVTLVTAVALGGCGDGSAATSPAATTAAATSPAASSPGGATAVSIEAEAHEWDFTPDSWTVKAGEAFTLEFTNDGGTEHEWAVLQLGEDIETAAEFDDGLVLFEVADVPAQESVAETFTIDEPGSYQVVCAISGHFNSGMEGTLTVT